MDCIQVNSLIKQIYSVETFYYNLGDHREGKTQIVRGIKNLYRFIGKKELTETHPNYLKVMEIVKEILALSIVLRFKYSHTCIMWPAEWEEHIKKVSIADLSVEHKKACIDHALAGFNKNSQVFLTYTHKNPKDDFIWIRDRNCRLMNGGAQYAMVLSTVNTVNTLLNMIECVGKDIIKQNALLKKEEVAKANKIMDKYLGEASYGELEYIKTYLDSYMVGKLRDKPKQ